jgi:hypothetical protein
MYPIISDEITVKDANPTHKSLALNRKGMEKGPDDYSQPKQTIALTHGVANKETT